MYSTTLGCAAKLQRNGMGVQGCGKNQAAEGKHYRCKAGCTSLLFNSLLAPNTPSFKSQISEAVSKGARFNSQSVLELESRCTM